MDLCDGPVDAGAESGLEEDLVVSRKNKAGVLLSDDDVDEADTNHSGTLVDASEEMLFSPPFNGEKTWDAKRVLDILDSDSEYEDSLHSPLSDKQAGIPKNKDKTESAKSYPKLNGASTLVDTDSGEDDPPPTRRLEAFSNRDNAKSNVPNKEGKPAKKRTGSVRAAKEEAMREIYSETQRMFRESEVRLPYHKPRQRSLQEFLNRRKNLQLPTTLTTVNKVKMSVEIVSKVLEEKEKEAELFYKSSESEDEESVAANDRPQQALGENYATEDMHIVGAVDPGSSQIREDIARSIDESLGSISCKVFDFETQIDTIVRPSRIEAESFAVVTNKIQNFDQTNREFGHNSTCPDVPPKFVMSNDNGSMDIDFEPTNENSESSNGTEEIQEVNPLEKRNAPKNAAAAEPGTEDFELKMFEDLDDVSNGEAATGNSETPKIISTKLGAQSKTSFLDDKYSSQTGKSDDNEAKSNERTSPINESSLGGDNSENVKKTIGHVYGLPLPEFAIDSTQATQAAILPNIMNLTPRLQGSSDTLIELTHRSGGVSELMKRFLRHSVPKTTSKSSPDVTVVRTECTENGLKVVSEILPYNCSPAESNNDPELSKPGAKLTRLKEELQLRMAARRTEERKQKELQARTSDGDDDDDVTFAGELSDCGTEGAGDVENGEEEEEKEVEEEEEEEEEGKDEEGDETSGREDDDDDVPRKERKDARKNLFANAEAEEDNDEEPADEEDGEEADCDDDSDEEDCWKSEYEAGRKKASRKLRRITKAFDDEDSNDSEVEETKAETNETRKLRIRRIETDVDMFSTQNNSDDDWLSGTEADLPAFQRRVDGSSQVCATPATANNSLSIVSPITQLTALNTRSEFASADLSLGQISSQPRTSLSAEKTPIDEGNFHRLCDPEKREKLQKKLFHDLEDAPTDSELIGMRSGRSDGTGLNALMHMPRKSNVSDVELLELCSGTFESQVIDAEELVETQDKGADEFSKESPLLSLGQSLTNQMREREKTSDTLNFVFSSDEDDVDNPGAKKTGKKYTKKKVAKLKLSEDEEENNDVEGFSDVGEKTSDNENFVDYDSEENEIIVAKKDLRKAAARFLEEEAELSGSEAGSADEDERDLDKLDVEEGDLEDIDQDQVRNQLEKIHMRQILDADQREVRLLQEILLEDGELHSEGAGRERKFRWRNIDKLEEAAGENQPQNSEEEAADPGPSDEIESEMEWRKQRFEREQFLQEHEKVKEASDDIEEEAPGSELFRLGMKALKKNKAMKLRNKEVLPLNTDKLRVSVVRHTVADLFESPGSGERAFTLQNAIRRGSFLARGEESLARLAAITRRNNDQAILRPKNSRNFVFAQISPAVEVPGENDGELDGRGNAKATDERMKQRKRKPTPDTTPVISKKTKREHERSNRSKLFN